MLGNLIPCEHSICAYAKLSMAEMGLFVPDISLSRLCSPDATSHIFGVAPRRAFWQFHRLGSRVGRTRGEFSSMKMGGLVHPRRATALSPLPFSLLLAVPARTDFHST